MLGYRKYRQGESATEYHDSLGRIIMVSYRYGIVLYAVICCDGTLHFLAYHLLHSKCSNGAGRSGRAL